jgi:hypothetical protein
MWKILFTGHETERNKEAIEFPNNIMKSGNH